MVFSCVFRCFCVRFFGAVVVSFWIERLQPCAYHVVYMLYTVGFCSALLFFSRQCFAVWFHENWRVVWGLLAFSMSCARTSAHAYSPEIRLCAPKHTHNKSCYFRSVGPVSEESAVTFGRPSANYVVRSACASFRLEFQVDVIDCRGVERLNTLSERVFLSAPVHWYWESPIVFKRLLKIPRHVFEWNMRMPEPKKTT